MARESRPPRQPGEPRDPRDYRQPGEPRDPRDYRQLGEPRDPRDIRQPGDPKDVDGEISRTEHNVHRILGIFFTLLGLFVSVDLLHLTVQFKTEHQRLDTQIICNETQNNALVEIGKARRDVDSAALFYDETLQVFLSTPVDLRQPDDPATQDMSRALNLLVAARKQAVTAYENNPFEDCSHG